MLERLSRWRDNLGRHSATGVTVRESRVAIFGTTRSGLTSRRASVGTTSTHRSPILRDDQIRRADAFATARCVAHAEAIGTRTRVVGAPYASRHAGVTKRSARAQSSSRRSDRREPSAGLGLSPTRLSSSRADRPVRRRFPLLTVPVESPPPRPRAIVSARGDVAGDPWPRIAHCPEVRVVPGSGSSGGGRRRGPTLAARHEVRHAGGVPQTIDRRLREGDVGCPWHGADALVPTNASRPHAVAHRPRLSAFALSETAEAVSHVGAARARQSRHRSPSSLTG